MQISADLHGFFILILAGFTLGSTFLSAYSILNVVRLRNVRLSWNSGKLGGYPLFATAFLFTTLLLSAVVYRLSIEQYYPVVGCYAWIGLNWFAASFLASRRYITDHGIVKNINDPSQTVPWYRMTDFVEKPAVRGQEYIFIYRERAPDERENGMCIRLELQVPVRELDEFKKIVTYKLGKTISPDVLPLLNTGEAGN